MNTTSTEQTALTSTTSASPPQSQSATVAYEQNTDPFWLKIEARAKRLARFDASLPRDRFALERLRRQVKKVADYRFSPEDICHRFQSLPVLQQTARWAAKRLAYFRKVFDTYEADNSADVAKLEITRALGKNEAFFFLEDETIVPELGIVTKPGIATSLGLIRSVLDAVRQYAAGTAPELVFPESLPDHFKQWRLDLKHFLTKTGDEGRKLVVNICESSELARTLHDMPDTKVAPCLQFLAARVIELDIRTQMPSRTTGGLGFAPNS